MFKYRHGRGYNPRPFFVIIEYVHMVIEEITKIYKNTKTLHHAYILVGDHDTLRDELLVFCENTLKISTKSNPDFIHKKHATFGIDDARELTEWANKRAFSDNIGDVIQIAILSCTTMTHEAQNALLKLFEEPTEGTHFFIIASSIETFLPTLRSRCEILSDNRNTATSALVKEFLIASKGERMEIIKKMLKRVDDAEDKREAIQFVNNLEKALYQKYVTHKNQNRNQNKKQDKDGNTTNALQKSLQEIQEVIDCKKFLQTRAPSIKMILEHLALVID